jgi:multisubunit Na+/H+ antiporter MnhB subunit
MYEFLYKIADPVGIIGVVLILIAYYYLSVGKWIADSMLYQFLNFLGAWLILYSLYFHWNTSSVVIEVAWIAISMLGMYRAVRFNKKKAAQAV